MNSKILVLLTIISCTFANPTNAQDDTLRINAGAMVVPMGWITPNEGDKGFETTVGVFGVAQFIQGNTVITPFFSMTTNSLGAAVYQQLTPNFGMYVVGTKSALRNNGYAGIGAGTPLAFGRATGFVEYGSSWQTWQPAIYIGAFIPIVRKLR